MKQGGCCGGLVLGELLALFRCTSNRKHMFYLKNALWRKNTELAYLDPSLKAYRLNVDLQCLCALTGLVSHSSVRACAWTKCSLIERLRKNVN